MLDIGAPSHLTDNYEYEKKTFVRVDLKGVSVRKFLSLPYHIHPKRVLERTAATKFKMKWNSFESPSHAH